jgi:large subunit ribosomal protein L21
MYAIVRTGGKQYRVERGQRLLVERLAAKEGAEVSLEPLLYRSEEPVLDKAGLEQVQVTAKVVEHLRGKKLRVFKFKPKRGYKRRTGHRQELTRIEVTEIAAQKARRASARAGAPEGTGEAPAKPAASKRAAGADGARKARVKPAGGAKRASAASKATAKPARGAKVGGPAKATAKPARATKAPPEAEPGEKAAAKPRRPAKARKDKDGA